MNEKQLQLAPWLNCAGPMFYDYLCKGCVSPTHWFYFKGDPAVKESLGHGAHYMRKQGAVLQESTAKILATSNFRHALHLENQ
jgi:hypothetical protein